MRPHRSNWNRGFSMARIDELKDELDHLNFHIKAGERFEAEGYDCGGMNALNIALRDKIAQQIKEIEDGDIGKPV